VHLPRRWGWFSKAEADATEAPSRIEDSQASSELIEQLPSQTDLHGAARAINGLIKKGDSASAIALSRVLRLHHPDHDRPRRLLVRSLLIGPLTEEVIPEAVGALTGIVKNQEQRHVRLASRLAVASAGTSHAQATAMIFEGVFEKVEPRRPALAVEVAIALSGAGHSLIAARIAKSAIATGSLHPAELSLLARSLADDTLVAELEEHLPPEGTVDRSLFESGRLERFGNRRLAFEAMVEAPVSRPADFSGRFASLAKQLGRYQELLDYLDNTQHHLGLLDEANHRFDVLWALGRKEEAVSALANVDDPHRLYPGHLIRVERAFGDAGIMDAVACGGDAPDIHVSGRIASAFLLTDRARSAIEELERWRTLPPTARLTLARALYCERRFEDANALLPSLIGTNQDFAARKLAGRILIERGMFAEALASRRAAPASAGFDEVVFHALLGLGQFDHGFAVHPWPSEMARLKSVFNDNADEYPSVHVSSRFVISEGGPGDEIQYATLFGELAKLADTTYVTTEPRLLSLMQRSFPDIVFVPVRRTRDGEFDVAGLDEPARMQGELHHLLTEEAAKIAETCDSVVFSKAIQRMIPHPSESLPARPHLVANPLDVTDTGRRRVGIVWRSELRSAWRNIHYLTAQQLGPLLELDVDFVCLQHDVDAEERQVLRQMSSTIEFLYGINLRDDFERTASLVHSLDAVVGIGTSVLNLAAAVGTDVVMMQPTHFGSWRSGPDHVSCGQDFWYDKAVVVTAEPPHDKQQLVRLGANELRVRLGL